MTSFRYQFQAIIQVRPIHLDGHAWASRSGLEGVEGKQVPAGRYSISSERWNGPQQLLRRNRLTIVTLPPLGDHLHTSSCKAWSRDASTLGLAEGLKNHLQKTGSTKSSLIIINFRPSQRARVSFRRFPILILGKRTWDFRGRRGVRWSEEIVIKAGEYLRFTWQTRLLSLSLSTASPTLWVRARKRQNRREEKMEEWKKY